jgi:hypothetical protein
MQNMKKSEIKALAPTRIRTKINICTKNVRWHKEEDELLMKLMLNNDHPNYSKMTKQFPGKTGQQISERWDKVLNPGLVKGSWTRYEDEVIIKFVKENGTKNWRKLCDLLPGRIGKQCRERWINHLDPSINHDPWTPEEDELLIKYHNLYGNKWVTIAGLMKTRSDNAIKNRWNATLKKATYKQTFSPNFYAIEKVNDQPQSSPDSTPVLQNLRSSPLLSGFSSFGIPMPKLKSDEKPNLSLADNWAILRQMIPKIN